MTHSRTSQPCNDRTWFKSSYSEGSGNACVEVAITSPVVSIRDSKDKARPALVVPASAWTSFVGLILSGDVASDAVG
ncbi:DUF397 domain-containing protein [Streptomyces sp. x-80]|uniref:DUF397 domain-containing protein n=1 Tax=Streptomyces sp. x-80 TaxID=2789282 RepID=UPI003980F5FC